MTAKQLKSCLADLNALLECPCPCSTRELAQKAREMAQAEGMPKAQLKKLVVEAKLPLHIYSACSRAAQQYPQTSIECAALAVAAAFNRHLVCLPVDGSSSCVRAWGQQVQRSGLVGHLPNMLAAAAEELALQAANADVAADAASNYYSVNIAIYAGHLLTVLSTLIHFSQQPQNPHGALFVPCLAPGMYCVLAAWQYVGSMAKQLQRPTADNINHFEELQQLLNATCEAAQSVTGEINRTEEAGQLAPLQLHTSAQHVCSVMAVLTLMCTVITAAGSSGGGSSSSSSSSSRSSRRSTQQQEDFDSLLLAVASPSQRAMLDTWSRARSMAGDLPCSVSRAKMVHLLRLNKRGLCWAAASMESVLSRGRDLAALSLSHLLGHYLTMVASLFKPKFEADSEQQQQPQPQQQEQQQDQEQQQSAEVKPAVVPLQAPLGAHLAMHAVLLRAALLRDTSASEYGDLCDTAALATHVIANTWTQQAAATAGAAGTAPQTSADAAAAAAANWGISCTRVQEDEPPPLLPPLWVEETLPLALRLAAQLRGLIRVPPAGAGAAAALGSSSGGSSMEADTRNAYASTAVLLCRLVCGSFAQQTDASVVKNTSNSSGSTSSSSAAAAAASSAASTSSDGDGTEAPAAAASSGASSSRQQMRMRHVLHSCVQQHAAEVFAALEGFVRLQAAPQQRPNRSEARALHLVAQTCGGGSDISAIYTEFTVMAAHTRPQQRAPTAAADDSSAAAAAAAGVAAAGQQAASNSAAAANQYFSLLATMLKYSAWGFVCAGDEPAEACTPCMCGVAVLKATVMHILHSLTVTRTPPEAAGDVAAAQADGAAQGGAAHRDTGGQEECVESILPALVLFGRCCQLFAVHAQKRLPDLLDMFSRARPIPTQGLAEDPQLASISCAVMIKEGLLQSIENMCPAALCFHPQSKVAEAAYAVRMWLLRDVVAAKLAALGYQPQVLLQQLESFLAAAGAAVEALGPSAAPFEAVLDQMTAVGRAFSAQVPVPQMCNNPGCTNVAGPSDLALVAGRSCVCGGCLTARYCSRACQRVHWKAGHKPVCKALAAAAAGAAESTGAAAPAAGS